MSSKTPLVVLFLAGIALHPILGQQKVAEKPTPAAQDYSREAFVIEKHHTRIVAEDDGSNTRETTAEVKILADAGVKAFAVLNFTYTSADEVVDIDYVRVRKPDGTIVKTPDYNIQDMPGEVTRVAPMYSDVHEKHVAVKALAVGDVMEYLVRYRVVKPQVPGQFWFEESFTKEAIVKDEQLEISVPKAKYVKVVSPDFKPEITEDGTRRIYHWTHSNLVRPEKDANEIPKRTLPTPSVQVTTFASWEDVGRWYGGLQKDPMELTPAIRAKAAELTKGLKTDDEKIRAIYNFVSLKFHYIGLDFGIGRYQPHPADDVLGNGYGDCKDKHTLLAALLKVAGYDAWPALIHASRKLDPDVPSPAQFNHVITVVPNGGKYIWLDTTPEVSPYELLIAALRDKQALVIPSDKAPLLMTTPANPPFRQLQSFTAEGKLDSDGTFTGHVEHVYRGDVEVALRMAFRQISESQWKEGVQRFSNGLGFGGEVSNVTMTPPDDTEKPLRISYDYLRKNYSDWEHSQITPPLPPMGVEASKDSKKPQESVLLGGLGEVVYNSKITLPPGYFTVAPKGTDLVKNYAEYHSTANLKGGVLTSSRRLVVKKNEVELAEWEDYRDFGKAIYDDEYNYIRLSKDTMIPSGSSPDLDQKFREASQYIQTRDTVKAKALLEEIIRTDPKYPMAHLGLAGVLFVTGKTDEGLAESHKEQEISPNDVRAYALPAGFLALLNRKDDAIAEWRKLLTVDPKSSVGVLTLSKLLSEEGKYSEAAKELEKSDKLAPGNPYIQMALGTAYAKTGQKEKAIESMRRVSEQKNANEMTLNDVAYTLAENKIGLDLAQQYAEEALKKLDQRSFNDVAADDTGASVTLQLAALWDTAGWVYFQSGDAARAEGFVRAAWLLGQSAVIGEHLGEIYEKEGKTKLAAHAYELALAAADLPPSFVRPRVSSPGAPLIPTVDPNGSQGLAAEITARYQKLTGKKPSMHETVRLPNGEWTKTPGEQLSLMRTVKFGKLPNFTGGSAEFAIVFAPPGSVQSVEYVRGEDTLIDLTDKIKAAHYQVEFPPDSKARIRRSAEIMCSPSAGCVLVLMPVSAPVTPPPQ